MPRFSRYHHHLGIMTFLMSPRMLHLRRSLKVLLNRETIFFASFSVL